MDRQTNKKKEKKRIKGCAIFSHTIFVNISDRFRFIAESKFCGQTDRFTDKGTDRQNGQRTKGQGGKLIVPFVKTGRCLRTIKKTYVISYMTSLQDCYRKIPVLNHCYLKKSFEMQL